MSTAKTPLELAALATVAVPGLRVAGLRAPQYSDDLVSVTGIVDSSGNRWTVTSPHDVVGGLELEDQDALLRRFTQAYESRLVPFRVPVPVGFARLKDGTRVIVHHDLGGRFMEDEDFNDPHLLPVSLGRAIGHLHNLPTGIYEGLDLPSYTAGQLRNRHLAVMDEAATHTLIPANLWNRWEGALNDIALWRFATVPVHGDLQLTNVCVHEGTVRTLSGFTSAHIGDPATDFSWVLAQSGDEFLLRFREAYSMTRPYSDIHIETRAQLISELAILHWLMHGVRAGNKEIVQNARTMLADLSEDVGDERLVAEPIPVTPASSPSSPSAESAESVGSLHRQDEENPANVGSPGNEEGVRDVDPEEVPTQRYAPFTVEDSGAPPTDMLNLDEFGRVIPER